MSCDTLRERFTADPSRGDAEFDRHVEACPACDAYRNRLLKTESLIEQALRFDVAGTRAKNRRPSQRVRSIAVGAGLAASLVAAATLWFWLDDAAPLTRDQLALEVAEHWYDEPEAWIVSGQRAADALVREVLGGAASVDLDRVEAISFARSCLVAGERVPHFVVQGEQGPVMVLLLPGRALATPVPLEVAEEGLAGQIVPAGSGSIAVLGAEADETARVSELLLSTVEWTPE